ncbi:uncharacterized protein LOC124311002 [Daphnia pulicaria]|uniref:uncharacterized protein LOC124311002 n=1 Tax=Daphnia pulicaria TaxID=35523 RepID=UPI001EEBDDD3|nr:uncharacterized protein LOC124311002 [Daphnia pulicaria]
MMASTSSTSGLARLHRLALLLLLAVYLNVVSSQGSSCQLPDAWRGTWFQSGLNTVRINETTIDFKGKCLESDGEYYLFEEKLEKEEKCYRCLFIAQKHPNVLQYKESYCEGRDTLENLCSMIPGDAQQYSLFRRDAAPVECPFRGSYTFTYSRGHGECRSPVSRLDSCTESWRTFFRYQACPDVQGTESSEEQLECLAQWKDGSLRYLMGRLQHQGATSDEDRYRCFVYEKIQPPPSSSSLLLSGGSGSPPAPAERHRPVTILLAQSGDATCSGLTSPTEGSRTLKLTKAEADGRKCHYPSWFLAHNRWQTLDGRWTYALHKNSTMRIINNTTSGHATLSSAAVIGGGGLSFGSAAGSASVDSRMEQKAACQSVLDLGDGAARVVAHLSQGCQSGYVCMVFYRRDSHVVEFQAGEAAPAPDEACSAYYFNPVVGHLTTLIAASHHSVACPLDGKFNVMRGLGHASSRLPCSSDSMANDVTSAVATPHLFLAGQRTSAVAVGCSAPDTLDLYHECSRETSSGYLCRSTWNDDHDERIKYVIVTPLHAAANRHGVDGPPRRFCLTVTTHGSKASTLTPSDLQSQHPQDHVSSVSNNGAPLEWIASSETCVRTYARDRLATHGQHSTHLAHNAHNLHITTADGEGNSAGASVFNVTSAGQCTGVEAAILDQRKLFPSSSSSSSSTSATAALLSPSTMDYVWLLSMVVASGRLVGR